MRAFVVRPFGVKNGIDFDLVGRDLILPALQTLDISGITTFGAAEPGGLTRPDFYELLITSDLVVVDVSVGTPDFFYTVGLAQGLRDKRTVFLSASTAERSFGLQSERCFIYDGEKPGSRVQDLIAMLRGALASDQSSSPVYLLLPGLEPPRTTLVPRDFQDEVEAAARTRDLGQLRLLSHEARYFYWGAEGLKLVGDAQFQTKDMPGARETFEFVISLAPENLEVNLKLVTVYQRLKQPRLSDEAIRRVLKHPSLISAQKAEAYALLGRNSRNAWTEQWRAQPESQRREQALRSTALQDAYGYYLQGFKEDLNSYYAGLNALAMGTIAVRLASDLPQVWAESFGDQRSAKHRLATVKKELDAIRSTVQLSLEAARGAHPDDVWLAISTADFALYTSDRPGVVADSYRRAVSGAGPFIVHAALNQVSTYYELGVRPENAKAAMEVLGESAGSPVQAVPAKANRALLFVGHAIDASNRRVPRFPADQEPAARKAIAQAVEELTRETRENFMGVAGGSSGGDILFHEACEELSIPGIVCLAVPPPAYLETGVAEAGPQWERRFRDLITRRTYRVLSNTQELPLWLRRNQPYDFWLRDTLWRYHTAAAIGDITVLALWDGQEGAAANMMRVAKEGGANIVVLEPARIFRKEETTAKR